MTQEEARLDPQGWARQRMAENKPAMAWQAQSLPAMRGWQRRARAHLWRLAGVPSRPDAPLNAEVVETRLFDRYRREAIRFQSRAGLEAFGYFLVPHDCRRHSPAVLCLPGHGRGVDDIVGIAEDGSQRPPGQPDGIHADYALQCVAHGYPAFALEQISFGRRRDAQALALNQSSSCRQDSMAALMLGETITGWRVWDAMRALDYMVTRSEVDKNRLGVMGLSGGGLVALWTACLDTRIRAAVVSGYFNTFRDSILAMDHCVDNYVPGLLSAIEMPDMAGLVAPRALFVEGGTEDPIFPQPAFERAVARAREIYAALGAERQFASEAFEGGHRFHGAGAFRFLKEQL